MIQTRRTIAMLAAAASVILVAAACSSNGSGYTRTTVSTGYYSGPGWYDPYYGRRYYGSGTVIVRPPGHGHRPGQRPPGARPPGARPPGRPTHLPARPRPRRR